MIYKGFTIKQNEYGTFSVPVINCFATPTIKTAQAAIDRYIAAQDKRSGRA